MAIHTDEIANEAGTGPVDLIGQSAAKFSVSGSSGSIQVAYLNASSVTDNGTGDYTYSFVNNFDTFSYAQNVTGRNTNEARAESKTASDIRVQFSSSAGAAQDDDGHGVTIHGTLA